MFGISAFTNTDRIHSAAILDFTFVERNNVQQGLLDLSSEHSS
jgi:hypothetical protein